MILRGDLDAYTSAPLLPDGRIGRVTHDPNNKGQGCSRRKGRRGIFRYMSYYVHFDSVATYCTIGCTTRSENYGRQLAGMDFSSYYITDTLSYPHTQHGISRASSARDRRCTTSFEPHESYPAALPHDLLLISRVLPQHLDGPGRADRPKRLRCLMAHLMREAIRGHQMP